MTSLVRKAAATLATAALAALTGAAAPALATERPAQPGVVTSSSWGGYYLSGSAGAFSSVSADWTAPTATCVAGSQFASFWVGLDGLTSSSVEQVGTEADCSGGKPTYFGWYDLFPAVPVNFSNKVSPGDAMTASVTFSGTRTFTLVLQDATAGWTQTITQNAAGLQRSSAEVVISGPGAGSKLTNFGKLSYSDCMVNGVSMGTQSPVKVVMTDGSGNVMVTTSAMTAAGKFTNVWQRGS
jgi:hypothetical protein